MIQNIVGWLHTRFSPTEGVENYINKLVLALLSRNWQIHYFTARIEQHIPRGIIINKIPVIRGMSVSHMLSFAYGARRDSPTGKPVVGHGVWPHHLSGHLPPQ